ncbi:MAG: mycofactocin-associated electron transfer flavoprotein alpha subunit [Acidimicrobiales bacterium]
MTVSSRMVAVVPVRDGVLPLGADEAVAEAGGDAVLIGGGARGAAARLRSGPGTVRCVEAAGFAPGAWAGALAPLVAEATVVVLPASPDGRDLAPRLAHVLGRPLLAGATSVRPACVAVTRRGGLVGEVHDLAGPVVATLEPGVRGVEAGVGGPELVDVALAVTVGGHDATVVEVLPPDPATVDLAEAARIVAGGAGLGGPEPFAVLERVAAALGASPAASRVASDAGWAPPDRYIGTTGVTVDPELYVALAISGAVQHVTGLGDPTHIVSVNIDAGAPMMTMADLAIVTDARALLVELARRLDMEPGGRDTGAPEEPARA